MTLVVRPGFAYDTDASNYIDAVEVADTQALETATRYAINDFVIGCKQDGIWSAIKASCILAGARTLAGALVPLVKQSADSTPASFGTAGGWNYNRKTGLQGNGTDNYINSGRNNNADPQNSRHMAVWRTTSETRDVTRFAIATANGTGMGQLYTTTTIRGYRSAGGDAQFTDSTTTAGFWGHSRSDPNNIIARYAGSSAPYSVLSQTPLLNENLQIFARSAANFSNARIAFYSIGESLDLAALDTRVTTLINQFGAAIP